MRRFVLPGPVDGLCAAKENTDNIYIGSIDVTAEKGKALRPGDIIAFHPPVQKDVYVWAKPGSRLVLFGIYADCVIRYQYD